MIVQARHGLAVLTFLGIWDGGIFSFQNKFDFGWEDTYKYLLHTNFYIPPFLKHFMNLVLVKCTFPSHYFRSHSLSRANVT